MQRMLTLMSSYGICDEKVEVSLGIQNGARDR
jgi:hypothetical protein